MEQINSWILKQYVALTTPGLREREEGQALVEYGILVALIAVVVIGTVVILGSQISTAFAEIVAAL